LYDVIFGFADVFAHPRTNALSFYSRKKRNFLRLFVHPTYRDIFISISEYSPLKIARYENSYV